MVTLGLTATAQQQMVHDDPRIGLKAGLFDAGEVMWNMRKVASVQPPEQFVGVTNSDLAFQGDLVFQGNYNGIIVWDISDPSDPQLVVDYLCPASQSDVSVYGHLLFVSGEGYGGRLDCGTEGVEEAVSHDRLRGIRIFDISDIQDPQYVHNVQTCRGSHTHSLLKDPDDDENVYIYVSGSAPVRPAEELAGCSDIHPTEDESSALFRIEVIKVPLADPTQAAIVSSPRIFEDLEAPPRHGPTDAEREQMVKAIEEGAYVVEIFGQPTILPDQFAHGLMADFFETEGITEPTADDSTAFRDNLNDLVMEYIGAPSGDDEPRNEGPDQCHDITLYPEIGMAGGACEGYGMLLDIRDPENPVRLDAVADSNFSYWHSATFSNDGSKILFTDEWGGGGGPKCRTTDPMEWGANAYFTIGEDQTMDFKSYYKLPVPQTDQENCVAHNGSLIPIPGRDIFVQAWYQGGISISDWTDPSNVFEIAYHDRGPVNEERMAMGGSWSVYWYNGLIISSEIARGLDIFELTPSEHLSANEIAAANTVQLHELNAQGHPMFRWPLSFALARAHLDQAERSDSMPADQIAQLRAQLDEAEASNSALSDILSKLAQ